MYAYMLTQRQQSPIEAVTYVDNQDMQNVRRGISEDMGATCSVCGIGAVPLQSRSQSRYGALHETKEPLPGALCTLGSRLRLRRRLRRRGESKPLAASTETFLGKMPITLKNRSVTFMGRISQGIPNLA